MTTEATERVVQAARAVNLWVWDSSVLNWEMLDSEEIRNRVRDLESLESSLAALDRLDAEHGDHIGDANKMVSPPPDVCECGCHRDAHEAIDGECIVPKCVCLKYRPRVEPNQPKETT